MFKIVLFCENAEFLFQNFVVFTGAQIFNPTFTWIPTCKATMNECALVHKISSWWTAGRNCWGCGWLSFQGKVKRDREKTGTQRVRDAHQKDTDHCKGLLLAHDGTFDIKRKHDFNALKHVNHITICELQMMLKNKANTKWKKKSPWITVGSCLNTNSSLWNLLSNIKDLNKQARKNRIDIQLIPSRG